MFAVINAFIVPCKSSGSARHRVSFWLTLAPGVYFFYPETAYRSLEEMDEIFRKCYVPPPRACETLAFRLYNSRITRLTMNEDEVQGIKGVLDVVHVAAAKPHRYGKKGELLIRYEETAEAHSIAKRRRSSVAAAGDSGETKATGDSPSVTHNESI